jgi:hypothetical protein
VLEQKTNQFTVDGLIVATNYASFTIDGLISATQTQTFTVDGEVAQYEGLIHAFTIDGVITPVKYGGVGQKNKVGLFDEKDMPKFKNVGVPTLFDKEDAPIRISPTDLEKAFGDY